MNIKRLFILAGTLCLGLTIPITMFWLLSSTQETARAAGPWYVASTGDDSNSCLDTDEPCATINGAIGKASGGDTIYVAIGKYTGTGDEVVLIDKDITLSGGWDASFTTQNDTSTIDGDGVSRGVTVNTGVTATINHFTVKNGYTDGGGGGIRNFGDLTLTNSIIRDNAAESPGGGIIGRLGSSTIIIDTKIYRNEAGEDGGGIYLDNSDLTLIRSWVVGNAAIGNDGGGIQIDGVSSAYIENSVIAGNFTNGRGGGIRNGPYTIINSHIVGNVANDGAAIDANSFEIVVTNTLIISNTGQTGLYGRFGSVITLNYCDTYGNSQDGGDVTITRNNCLGAPPENGLDPLMAGGPLPGGVGPAFAGQWLSYDYRLLRGSPAIDAGTPAGAPATDIDGHPRDATPDIGAYEVGYPVVIDIKPGSDPNSINCNNAHGVIPVAILTTDAFDTATVDHATVTFEWASETHVNRKMGEPIRHVEDVDLDGDMDLVFHFRLIDTTLTCESTEGTLIGETYDGMLIEGSDSIRMINQESP